MSDFRLRRRVLTLFLFGVPALAFAWAAFAGEEPPGQASHTFRVDTPPIRFEPAPDGFARVEAPGLDSRHSPLGAPDLPTRTVLVAIPPGAEPRLEFRLPGSKSHRAFRPLPRAKEYQGPPALLSETEAPTRDFSRKPAPVYRADPAYYDGAESYPANAAWLGETGVLRDQRYVEVHVAPIRYERESGGLVVDSAIEVTVYFEGGEVSAEPSRSGGAFEAVYRDAFVNYAQGRRFRLDNPLARSAASTTSSSDEGPRRRIRVRENGHVLLDYDFLLAQAPEFLTEPVSQWKLTSQGVQVPLLINQIPGGGFDDALLDHAGEFIMFYGQALDLEPKSALVGEVGGFGDKIYEALDFSDENAYFLSVTDETQPAIDERDAAPGGEPEAGPYFTETRHAEVDEIFLPYGGFDLWYWLPVLTEADPVRTESVDLPGLYSGTLPATFRVNIKGTSNCREINPDQQTGAFVTNDLGQQLELPGDNPDNNGNVNIGVFEGLEAHIHEFDWVHSGANPELTNPVEVSVQVYDNTATCFDPPGEVRDEAVLDWIEIDYPREFRALGDSLTFSWDDGPATVFEIPGLSGWGEVYEITGFLGDSDVVNTVRLTDVDAFSDGLDTTIRFRMDNDPNLDDGTPRRFAITGGTAMASVTPEDFETDRVSDLAEDDSQADLVVIVHPDVVESYCSESAVACGTSNDCTGGSSDVCRLDPTSDLGQLLALRATQGISSRVARVPDIEDEFNHGLPGPKAIKQFLSWVQAGGWQAPPPTYAMLVGDGTYDYKGGTASGNYVPTQLMLKTDDILAYYSSDNLLANIVGDDYLPDLLVGRISVRTKSEAAAIFQKLLQYDINPPAGAWRSNALVISDRANDYGAGEAEDFEEMNLDALAWLAGTAYTFQNLRYWTDYCPGGPLCDKVSMRADIKAGVNGTLGPEADGASLLQFVGHGIFDMWSSDRLLCANDANEENSSCSPDDTLEFFNGGRLPWVVVHNCLSAGFHTTSAKSMGEQWLKRENGGAVAVFAPSGLGFRFIGRKIIEEIWGALYGPTKERDLIVPVMNSLVRICIEQPSPETCQYLVLLGDPTTRLVLPHVDPPSDLVAVAGNAVVDLSWSGSATTGASYGVYRASWFAGPQFAGSYSFLGEAEETSFTDSTVQNARDYIYYVVALDDDGFESAWSNFNSDCAEEPPGEDCVLARPLNLTPPAAPTGGHAEDTTSGGSLLVSWDRNAENDLDFYTVHHGATPELGQTLVHPRGFPTQMKIHGLTNGSPHHFAISVTNTSGATSVLSELFIGVPTQVLGVRAPDLVGGLRVDRAGADTMLSWNAVTHDIYGGEVVIGQYEVFRGTLPDFVPGPGSQLGSTPSTNFTDSGAFNGAQPDYYYLVRATDVDGNPGGAGRQLPNGIGDAQVEASATPGSLLISWSPVTTDFDGGITQISHYELYASDQPFGRGAIQQGIVALLQGGITETSVEFLPETQSRYYSVLAVDVRGNRSPF